MSRITIAQLEAFFWTARLRSVERAAQHLHLAQPTVSLRLKALEEAVHVPLFERAGRGLRLSLDGQALLPQAGSVLDSVGQMSRRSDQEKISGYIRIGFAEGFALICLPKVLERLQERHPDLQLECAFATSAAIEPDVREHRLDLAFLVNPIGPEGFTMLPLGTQETSWLAGNRWQLPETVRPGDLAHVPVLSNQPSSIGYRQVQAWFASAGIVPARLDICSSVTMLAHLVAAGTGVAILPTKLADTDALKGRVTILKSLPALESVPIFAIYHTSGQSPAIKAVIAVVREVLAGMDYLSVDR
ncbi:LysR family transcriptional regulator [Azospirillum sp. ST 5-10]|uniref:LysR family transcriptional regulator n=1 Tax=unclassified Azospirillum TaxID=2630922 RepID=UPI003F49E7B0